MNARRRLGKMGAKAKPVHGSIESRGPAGQKSGKIDGAVDPKCYSGRSMPGSAMSRGK